MADTTQKAKAESFLGQCDNRPRSHMSSWPAAQPVSGTPVFQAAKTEVCTGRRSSRPNPANTATRGHLEYEEAFCFVDRHDGSSCRNPSFGSTIASLESHRLPPY